MNSGISFKKKQKLWIWKAVDYETGQLLDWELGGRDAISFQRLFRRMEQRFQPKLYCTDDWEVYRKIIPENRLQQSKSGTSRVESNNADTRHWFARFRRRTRVVSQSALMVSLTLKLQAHWKQIFNYI
jgi:insertion element IS1 protein InsB